MMLKPVVFETGDYIIRHGEMGSEMYFICRGQVEVYDGAGVRLNTLGEGDFFGELSLLRSQPRAASIRAATACDVFVLDKADFHRVLRDRPQLVSMFHEVAKSRYQHA
jgi:CRP-like cAMP-binding protein